MNGSRKREVRKGWRGHEGKNVINERKKKGKKKKTCVNECLRRDRKKGKTKAYNTIFTYLTLQKTNDTTPIINQGLP